MAIAVRLPKVTREQYEKVSAQLTPTNPPGLLIHVSFGQGDGVESFQVWESEEAWTNDMTRVLPVLQGAGVEVGEPPTAVPVVAMQGTKVQS